MTTPIELPGRGSSLHIGVDRTDPEHYAGLKALRAAEHDARAMAELSRDQGYDPAVQLLGADATLEAVRDEIANAASVLAPGDTFLFSFAGHGGIVPDASGGRLGGVDRTMCLFDQQLIDSLLLADLARFQAGVRVILVTDSCPCSATVKAAPDAPTARLPKIRDNDGAGGDVRAMPADLALMIYRTHRTTYDAWHAQARGARRSATAPMLALTACQDQQEARESAAHGRFTAALLRAWNGGAYLSTTPEPSYRDLVDKINDLIADPAQVPALSVEDQRLAFQRPFVLGG